MPAATGSTLALRAALAQSPAETLAEVRATLESEGSVEGTAAALGVPVRTLYRVLADHGIDLPPRALSRDDRGRFE